jgi:hypothetical protein
MKLSDNQIQTVCGALDIARFHCGQLADSARRRKPALSRAFRGTSNDYGNLFRLIQEVQYVSIGSNKIPPVFLIPGGIDIVTAATRAAMALLETVDAVGRKQSAANLARFGLRAIGYRYSDAKFREARKSDLLVRRTVAACRKLVEPKSPRARSHRA